MYIWIEKGIYSTITSMSARAIPISSKLIGLILWENSWSKLVEGHFFYRSYLISLWERTTRLTMLKIVPRIQMNRDKYPWMGKYHDFGNIPYFFWFSTSYLGLEVVLVLIIRNQQIIFCTLNFSLKAKTGHRSFFTHLLILHFADKINILKLLWKIGKQKIF